MAARLTRRMAVGHWEAALELLREALVLGADARAFNGAMSACLKQSRWAVALEVYELMGSCQVQGNKFTLGSLMKAQGQASRWHLALAELARNEVDEVSCGVGALETAQNVGFEVCITACGAALQWIWALQVLEDGWRCLS